MRTGLRCLVIALCCFVFLSAGSDAKAQNFPTAPVRLVVTTGAGGAPNVTARIVAEGL